MALLNGFDKIAGVYDLLAWMVYGESLKKSQRYFIAQIPPAAKILILGGGTGWLLAEIVSTKPNCEVWYIEASEKMILSSKKKIKPDTTIHFIHGTEDNIPHSTAFDCVITNFYLDLFPPEPLKVAVGKINSVLKHGSFWIATDFVDNGKWWQHLMLKIMYIFFGVISGIEADRLPDWNKSLQQYPLQQSQEKFFYYGFIKTCVYMNVAISRKDF